MEENIKILIIDDDSFLLDMYALKFGKSEFKVSAALGPEDALNKLRGGLLSLPITIEFSILINDCESALMFGGCISLIR